MPKPWEPGGTWDDAVPSDFVFDLAFLSGCHFGDGRARLQYTFRVRQNPDARGIDFPRRWAKRYLPKIEGTTEAIWRPVDRLTFWLEVTLLPIEIRGAPGLMEWASRLLTRQGFVPSV